MPREVTDPEGTTWTAIQVFSGLGKDEAKTDAARVEGAPDHVHVVCTPSGGARSVRVQLPEDWETSLGDEEIAAAIAAAVRA
ncbi:hypothetical protein ACE7GA_08770 [Roseomonas sp. CCTCC AB2023176]|uniref:hypothetical protein n=1 Tax=Roseomonas sp. CCTCC AB2023176 TaxID=3342640 RepID=UPI0035DC41E1